MTNSANQIEIYTDGACSGNPGAGGWGAILLYKQHSKKISGFEASTTNNRMELRAVIESLKIIKDQKFNIVIYTDSKYVQQGMLEWIDSWKKNGWKNSKKQPVKNIDLWQELDRLNCQFHIKWMWVKGHNGNEYNEIADILAREAIINNK